MVYTYGRYFGDSGVTHEARVQDYKCLTEDFLANEKNLTDEQRLLAKTLVENPHLSEPSDSPIKVIISLMMIIFCTFFCCWQSMYIPVTKLTLHLVIQYLNTDLFVGMLHSFLDRSELIGHPIFGYTAFIFQIHHVFPHHYAFSSGTSLYRTAIERLPEVLWLNLTALTIWVVTFPFVSSSFRYRSFYGICTGVLAGYVALMSHFFAHIHPKKLPWMIRRLQDWQILLSLEKHKLHHCYFDQSFSLLSGITDPFVQKLMDLKPHILVHQTLFVLQLCFGAALIGVATL